MLRASKRSLDFYPDHLWWYGQSIARLITFTVPVTAIIAGTNNEARNLVVQLSVSLLVVRKTKLIRILVNFIKVFNRGTASSQVYLYLDFQIATLWHIAWMVVFIENRDRIPCIGMTNPHAFRFVIIAAKLFLHVIFRSLNVSPWHSASNIFIFPVVIIIDVKVVIFVEFNESIYNIIMCNPSLVQEWHNSRYI